MPTIDTKMEIPVGISRVVNSRFIMELTQSGDLQLWDSQHQQKLAEHPLVKGTDCVATFDVANSLTGGSVVIQQSLWESYCASEVSMHLGSVDFQYITGASYFVYPQSQRVSLIEVTFRKNEGSLSIIGVVTTGDGVKQTQQVDFGLNPEVKKTAFAVVFAGVSERYVVEEDGRVLNGRQTRQQRVASLATGGTVTLNFPIGGYQKIDLV